MNILALDLGTKTGWARLARGQQRSGSVSFAPRKLEGPGARWLRFRAFLNEQRTESDLGAIYFEDVKRHGPGQVLAAHIYGGFLANLEAWCEVNRVPLHGVGVGTVKKHWTGRGDALKAQMIAEAKRRGWQPKDDNEADAIALLDYGICDQGAPTPTAIEVPDARPVVAPAWADPLVPA